MTSPSSHYLHTQLLDTLGFSKKNSLEIARLLYELKNEANYKNAVGLGIDTWIDYLSQPEIGLSKTEADRLVQIHEQFVLRFGFDEDYISQIPIKNLHYILPLIKKLADDGDVDGLVNEAMTLTQRDLKERMQDRKNPDGERTYEYIVMKKCVETSNMRKVHGIESDTIKDTLSIE